MKYYFKFKFNWNYAGLIIWTIWIIRRFTSDRIKPNGFDVAMLIAYTLLWIVVISRNVKPIILGLQRKPLLEFNEEYIEDHVMNTRYDWIDISEVEIEDTVIKIYFYDIEKYNKQIRGFRRRWWVLDYRKRYLRISLSFISQDGLRKNMNDYSLPSTKWKFGQNTNFAG